MSISFGGLGLLSLRNPFSELVDTVLGKTDLRSLLCLLVFSIVFVILAYLTNPSENSFRAYLTEQSFRHHLSRLDDNIEDDQASRDNASPYSSKHDPISRPHALSFDNYSSFHFANSASLSLRTPKHVFHSFGVFTMAAMVPFSRSPRNDERETLMISDSWYIGAFGRWWRGGIIEAWYQDIITRTKDEESWTSGILAIKTSDRLNEQSGLPFSTKNLPARLLSRGSPPRLRNRDRSSQRQGVLPNRNSSPPPLPKSASLPLHAIRHPSSSSIDRIVAQPVSLSHTQPCAPSDQVMLMAPAPSKPLSVIFDQSPIIAEVLRQIAQSKSAVLDLRTQLTDYQSSAAQSHAQLQGEVDAFRERRRQEDASKLELRTRTKSLDDSRRNAESLKREAEKRLRAAQTACDNANQRMDFLDKEIAQLQQHLAEDQAVMRVNRGALSDAEREITEALEHRKREIKVAEDVVAALNQRARELEEKLAEEKECLASLKERNELRRQERYARQSHVTSQHNSPVLWQTSTSAYEVSETTNPVLADQQRNAFGTTDSAIHRPVLALESSASSSRSTNVTLASVLKFDPPSLVPANPTLLQPNSYHVFDEGVIGLSQQHCRHTTFSPFDDMDAPLSRNPADLISPTSQSLIPSGLITSLDNADGASRSFQSESDVFLERHWRGSSASYPYHAKATDGYNSGNDTMTASPVSFYGPSVNDRDQDPFNSRLRSGLDDTRDLVVPRRTSGGPPELQHSPWMQRTNSDPISPNHFGPDPNQPITQSSSEKSAPKRWFSIKEKPKKGLNPDAKVFSLSSKRAPPRIITTGPAFGDTPVNPPALTFDALNPTGLGSKPIASPASANSSLLRAFAPSPAEREALQRALGGSSNTSFERLPSLTHVGSIPSSPSHTHALSTVSSHIPPQSSRELGKVLPSWLQALPRIKGNFSPWDDEEAEVDNRGRGEMDPARRR